MSSLEITTRTGHLLGYEYEVKGTNRCFDRWQLQEIECWIINNEIDGGFYPGKGVLGFAREKDRTMFLLRFSSSV